MEQRTSKQGAFSIFMTLISILSVGSTIYGIASLQQETAATNERTAMIRALPSYQAKINQNNGKIAIVRNDGYVIEAFHIGEITPHSVTVTGYEFSPRRELRQENAELTIKYDDIVLIRPFTVEPILGGYGAVKRDEAKRAAPQVNPKAFFGDVLKR